MSASSRRRFQRLALVVIGCLLVVLGARQLAYAASGMDRCDSNRLGYYEEIETHEVQIIQHGDGDGDAIEMHVIVN